MILDVDGTLIAGKELYINKSVRDWVYESKKYFKVYLLSNNPSKRRIGEIAKQLDLQFSNRASKPRTKCLNTVLNYFPYETKEIAMIGDRIFTDVIAGNRLGLQTILVEPIKNKEQTNQSNMLQIIEKRIARILGGE